MTYERLHKAIREHSGMDDGQIREAGEHGADAGWAGFTYTGDCVEFYEANKDDIWSLAQDMADQMDVATVPALVASFNSAHLADSPNGFANLLAWFALEEIGRWLEDNPQEHEHEWGPLEQSRLAGTWHRKCLDPECRVINALDDDDE